jgi:hypothetical protein
MHLRQQIRRTSFAFLFIYTPNKQALRSFTQALHRTAFRSTGHHKSTGNQIQNFQSSLFSLFFSFFLALQKPDLWENMGFVLNTPLGNGLGSGFGVWDGWVEFEHGRFDIGSNRIYGKEVGQRRGWIIMLRWGYDGWMDIW